MAGKILITGGAGFIGSHVAERLATEGKEIIIADSIQQPYDSTVSASNLKNLVGKGNVEILDFDIRDPKNYSEIGSLGIESIIHAVNKFGIARSIADPYDYIDVNVKSTLNVLELARKIDAEKFIFTSTVAVYGEVPMAELPISEDRQLRPLSPYGASKLAAEIFCNTYDQTFGLETTILRYFTVYGPRQSSDEAVPTFTSLIFKNQPIKIFGDGKDTRDYTHISDAVESILLALRNKKSSGETINIGSGKKISTNDLIKIFAATTGVMPELKFSEKQNNRASHTLADISKAKKILGYNPQVGIEAGIKDFVKWFKAENNL